MSEPKERIHLAYSGNKRVFPMILLSALSVIKHTKEPVTFYLATMDLTEQDARFTPIGEAQRTLLETQVQAKNPENRVVLLDVKKRYSERFKNNKNAKNSYTPYALLRLLFDEFIFTNKLIYADADVMCRSDLKQLWEIDITGHEFAAVKDAMGKFWINRNYCNSGVLLLNLDYIRAIRFFERVIDTVCTKKLAFPDQSALNRLAKNKLILPRKFNEQRAIRQDTVLKHFCQGIKWFPFFKVYNYKQTERENVHKKLKIFDFDDIYAAYDEIAATDGIMQ